MEAIWNQAHPAENAGMSGSWPDAWGSTGAINDPDPAYRKYNAVKTFYEEHQYLAWYGNEESGQQTLEEPGVLASGEAAAGAGGTAQGGKLSGAEELAVRVVPKQKAARTWQPAREVRHPDTRGQTSPWRP